MLRPQSQLHSVHTYHVNMQTFLAAQPILYFLQWSIAMPFKAKTVMLLFFLIVSIPSCSSRVAKKTQKRPHDFFSLGSLTPLTWTFLFKHKNSDSNSCCMYSLIYCTHGMALAISSKKDWRRHAGLVTTNSCTHARTHTHLPHHVEAMCRNRSLYFSFHLALLQKLTTQRKIEQQRTGSGWTCCGHDRSVENGRRANKKSPSSVGEGIQKRWSSETTKEDMHKF